MGWSNTELVVFSLVGLMMIFKLWSVWHVARASGASRTGRMIFLGLISGMTLFGVTAKVWISYQLAV